MSLDAVSGLFGNHIDLVKAAILGIVEGLTEFLPVSSTGHLLLMEHFLGWGDGAFGKSFAILIQLGAILALLTIYFGRICNRGPESAMHRSLTLTLHRARDTSPIRPERPHPRHHA